MFVSDHANILVKMVAILGVINRVPATTRARIGVRGGGRGCGRPPGLEKFQGKRKLLKNPE